MDGVGERQMQNTYSYSISNSYTPLVENWHGGSVNFQMHLPLGWFQIRFITEGVNISAVIDTTFVDIYVDTKNIPTCRYNIQHIDKRTIENKMSIIMWEAAMSYATTFK